ncbi:MAG: bifunctional diaminohydroxyphosphoribosylaminopyrimidine deaminase/5-amino-6-(5-phosphoribosylamino)uracil reductase RibD [Bdellovibrionales bacterium]|nr:bifunctional diaminohydroxyphosphoribosylaminopyrimidine deaminase/5-amino-6-(5-phosphoribosylamino)uracil reductase RibD [Bdellovibrionales bacterium]
MKLTPKAAMLAAIEEGKKGSGFVSPNPLVGCVILDRDYNFLAKGYHARLGELHAETHALKSVTDTSRLKGAHMYVTLEPCAHEGRQPSCAKTLATLPLKSVTYGLPDPNPKVSGRGVEILRAAGLEVVRFAELQNELEELAEIFLMNMREGRPFVSVKVASSLDGQVALADGSSQWITSEASRGHVQSLRGFHDAVLTGAGTFHGDNPRLNSRDSRFADKRLPVILLDPDGSCVAALPGSALLQVRPAADVFLVTKPGVKVLSGVTHIELSMRDGEFDLRALVSLLPAYGVHSVFVEAGATTVSAFLRQRLCDRLYVFMAPKILGKGLGWTSALQIPSLEQAVRLENLRVEPLGEDFLFTGRTIFSTRTLPKSLG